MAGLEGDLVAAIAKASGRIVTLAKAKAPVRKVFGGEGRVRVRLKSINDVMADRDLRASLGLGPELMSAGRRSRAPQASLRVIVSTTNSQNVPFNARARHGAAPFLAGLPGGHLRDSSAEERLSRRGRYELRSGRANRRGYLGGRLRGEIYATAPVVEGSLITAQVISPTPYAKYQEFGTRHNAAHPYMRPALQEGAPAFISSVAAAVNEAVKRGVPAGGELVVKVMLEAAR